MRIAATIRLFRVAAVALMTISSAVVLAPTTADAGGLERLEKAAKAKPKSTSSARAKRARQVARLAAKRTAIPAAAAAADATPPATMPQPGGGSSSAQSRPDTPADPRIDRLQEGAKRAFDQVFGAPPSGPPGSAQSGAAPGPAASSTAQPGAMDAGLPLDTLKRLFARPPTARPASTAEVELGQRLFQEKKLSADHKMACATCHDPAQSLADGRARAKGNNGQALPRNTMSLWNVSAGRVFYWDGRAPTLEAQAKDAIEREGEMDATLEAGVVWLSKDPWYRDAFERAYPGPASLSGDHLIKALAAYQRTFHSPDTRFDRWVDGDNAALDATEVAGFRIFTGKGRCLACHGGWRFTDDKFHDIGLASADRGRAALPGVASAERAFKTPSLREAAWSAPYMHDGSLRTFDDVVAHYAGRLQRRASIAAELKQPIVLIAQERAQLVAFLKSLSSQQRPRVP